jgi:hypothetical protein
MEPVGSFPNPLREHLSVGRPSAPEQKPMQSAHHLLLAFPRAGLEVRAETSQQPFWFKSAASPPFEENVRILYTAAEPAVPLSEALRRKSF